MKLQYIIFLLFISVKAFANPQDKAILGNWVNEDSTQIVNIYKQNKHYFAKLVYLNDENAPILLDIENNDESLRKRKVLNAVVWSDFEYLADKNMWKFGSIYNYKTGNSYKGKIQIEDKVLKLTGYYGFFFFLAKTQKWYKVSK